MKNLTHIFGCPRSGTTWLWSLLEEHDRIQVLVKGEPIKGVYNTSESGVYLHPNSKKVVSSKCEQVLTLNSIVIEKTSIHTLHFDKINDMFPESRNILIVRNPLSIYESYEKTSIKGLPKDKQGIIRDIKNYFNKYNKIEKNSLVITYEDLKETTTSTLETIFDYLELPYVDYEHFNTHTKVNVKHVFRKGETKPSAHLDVLKNDFADEIKYRKSHLN